MLQTASSPLAGFSSPVAQSQQVFRAALDAFARPGTIVDTPGPAEIPAPLNSASAAICLALIDFETALWLDEPARNSEATIAFLRFHCGCPIVDDPKEAQFALVSAPASRPALDGFGLGSDIHPENAATVIFQVAGLATDGGVRLSGPGIERVCSLDVAGIDAGFWHERIGLQELFPRGIDLVFAADARLAAIPRSTLVEV